MFQATALIDGNVWMSPLWLWRLSFFLLAIKKNFWCLCFLVRSFHLHTFVSFSCIAISNSLQFWFPREYNARNMSSGFVTESEIAEAREKRQAEWEKVRQADQPLGNHWYWNLPQLPTSPTMFSFRFWIFTEMPEEPYDSRSLYERLKEQKDKKDLEFDEAHKLSMTSRTDFWCGLSIDSDLPLFYLLSL